MSNPISNPKQNYSGVTIQIENPAVNVSPNGAQFTQDGIALRNGCYTTYPAGCCYPNAYGLNAQNTGMLSNGTVSPDGQNQLFNQPGLPMNNGYYAQQGSPVNNPNPLPIAGVGTDRQLQPYNNQAVSDAVSPYGTNPNAPYGQAYPVQYYLNNYNMQGIDPKTGLVNNPNGTNNAKLSDNNGNIFDTLNGRIIDSNVLNQYKDYADEIKTDKPEDLTASKNIIDDLNKRDAEIKEAKKNTKEQKIVALTDEYIKSLESYLDNPDDEMRLMASKEILTRLDEDKNRYDDAALNALLNKMLQDPSKLVRISALSAFASQLACGNDYTVQLLQQIQSDPNGDKEDALQASDILLKMSAGVEYKDVPTEQEEEREIYKMKPKSGAK